MDSGARRLAIHDTCGILGMPTVLEHNTKDEKLFTYIQGYETFLVRSIAEQGLWAADAVLFGYEKAYKAHRQAWQYMGQSGAMLVWRLRKYNY